MSKEPSPDYSGFPITKLPPGRAHGAGDLKKWSHNRLLGRTGTGDASEAEKIARCEKCNKTTLVFLPRKITIIKKFRCRHCGWVAEARAIKATKSRLQKAVTVKS